MFRSSTPFSPVWIMSTVPPANLRSCMQIWFKNQEAVVVVIIISSSSSSGSDSSSSILLCRGLTTKIRCDMVLHHQLGLRHTNVMVMVVIVIVVVEIVVVVVVVEVVVGGNKHWCW